MTEQQLCDYMAEMNKLKKEEYSIKLAERIFQRYAVVDADSKEKVICEEGFRLIAASMKNKAEDSELYFRSVSDRKNQIDFDKFNEYMNSMIIRELDG